MKSKLPQQNVKDKNMLRVKQDFGPRFLRF